MSEPAIVLTDPKPIPKDGRCPRCRAPESTRQLLSAFGRVPWEACSSCGYEFPSED